MKELSIVGIIDNRQGLYRGHLRHYYRALLGATNLTRAYHNLRHMLHVLWECYDGGAFHRLSPRKMRNLLIAAIFHDFNHSGRARGNDHAEIEIALMMLRAHILPEDLLELENISDIIRATEFPYVIAEQDLTLSQEIIRDADMSQNFSFVWLQQSWLGLAEELGLDPVKFLRMQPGFLRGLKFHSGWGKEKFEGRRAAHIEEVEEYIELLDGDEPTTIRKVA